VGTLTSAAVLKDRYTDPLTTLEHRMDVTYTWTVPGPTAAKTMNFLAWKDITLVPHTPYSPDLVPDDF